MILKNTPKCFAPAYQNISKLTASNQLEIKVHSSLQYRCAVFGLNERSIMSPVHLVALLLDLEISLLPETHRSYRHLLARDTFKMAFIPC